MVAAALASSAGFVYIAGRARGHWGLELETGELGLPGPGRGAPRFRWVVLNSEKRESNPANEGSPGGNAPGGGAVQEACDN